MTWLLLGVPIAAFVLVVRELGQPAAARLCRLPVATFSLGYGRAWWQRTLASGTTFQLGRVPLGAAIELAPPRRMAHLVPIAAGAGATYLAIALVAMAHSLAYGIETGRAYVAVGSVLPGYDAEGKLEPGDRILATDGQPLAFWQLRDRVDQRAGAPMVLTIERAGQTRDVSVTPRPTEQPGRWVLGFRPEVERERDRDLAAAVGSGIAYPGRTIAAIARELVTMTLGDEEVDAGGPVRIVDEFRMPEPGLRLAIEMIVLLLTYALIVGALYDVVRAIALVLAVRRQRTSATATR